MEINYYLDGDSAESGLGWISSVWLDMTKGLEDAHNEGPMPLLR
jgi:hypothetical protein